MRRRGLSQTDAAALALLAARLDPKHPGFTASDEVRAALASIEPYLATYVRPLVAMLEHRPQSWEREMVTRDHAHMCRHVERGLNGERRPRQRSES